MKIRGVGCKGFTLIEIMIVVAMLGILATLAVSMLQGVFVRQQRSAAAQEIASLLNQARAMARSTAVPATVAVTPVGSPPGGSVTVTFGAPVNWSRTLSLGPGQDYNAVGIVGAAMGPFTILPRGTVTPTGFNLSVQDRDGQVATVAVGLLGDITITQ